MKQGPKWLQIGTRAVTSLQRFFSTTQTTFTGDASKPPAGSLQPPPMDPGRAIEEELERSRQLAAHAAHVRLWAKRKPANTKVANAKVAGAAASGTDTTTEPAAAEPTPAPKGRR